MRIKNVLAFVDQKSTTIACQYTPSGKLYTFRCPLGLSTKLSLGDQVIAESGRVLAVVTVCRIDDEPEIDLDADFDYRWAFQKVDTGALELLQQADQEQQEEVRKNQRNAMREKLRQQLLKSLETPASPEAPNHD